MKAVVLGAQTIMAGGRRMAQGRLRRCNRELDYDKHESRRARPEGLQLPMRGYRDKQVIVTEAAQAVQLMSPHSFLA
jgi:hypothetical protein